MCSDLYFDKIQNLNGYNLKAVLWYERKVFRYDSTKLGYDKCRGTYLAIICDILINHMNANITVKLSESAGFIDEYEQPHGSLEDVLSGTAQISMTPYFLRRYWKIQLYPYLEEEFKIVSANDLLQFSDRFFYIFNLKTWLFLVVSCFISVVILMHTLNEPTSEAALEFIRMLASTSTLRQPRNLSGKIFLINMVLIAFMIGSFIQGRLSSINTVEYRTSIDTYEDLTQSNFPIYGLASHLNIFIDPLIRKRFHIMSSFEQCVDVLSKGDQITCAYAYNFLRHYIHETELIHISKNNIFRAGISYTCNVDSPFLSRMNRILSRINEGGFIALFYARDEPYSSKNSYGQDNLKMSLDIKNLITNFHILLAGWTCGIVAFLFELVIYWIKKRNIKLSRKFMQQKFYKLKKYVLLKK